MKYKIIKNKFGYYEIKKKPNKKFLSNYYKTKYYQQNKGNYNKKYTNKDELKYINYSIELKFQVIKKITKLPENFSLLDVGCGEGWVLNFFRKITGNILGIDYSNFGLLNHNKHCKKYFIEGDIDEIILKLHKKNKKFDIIWLENILEHVISPINLLNNLHLISNNNTILVIEVPNDFSLIQNYAYKNNLIPNKFWIVFPDHLSYFNKDGLINLANYCNWKNEIILGDFPIDFNLYNKSANYVIDKSKGKDAHMQRVILYNLIFENNNINSIIKFYSSLAEIGLGRQIIGFFKPII